MQIVHCQLNCQMSDGTLIGSGTLTGDLGGITIWTKLGSVTGFVIQANGRMSFKDDLRSEGLLYCVSH